MWFLSLVERNFKLEMIEKKCQSMEVFTNFPQYKKANIANFILAVPLEMNETEEVFITEM